MYNTLCDNGYGKRGHPSIRIQKVTNIPLWYPQFSLTSFSYRCYKRHCLGIMHMLTGWPIYWSWWVMQQANKTHNLVPTLLYWAQYPFFPPSSIKSPFSKFVQTSRTVPLQSEISPHIQHWLMETEKPSSFLSRSLRTATKIKHIITNI